MTDRSEQAGRADSSASDVERARRFFNSMKPTVWPHVGEVAALATEFAAIRREAIETSQAERRVIEAAKAELAATDELASMNSFFGNVGTGAWCNAMDRVARAQAARVKAIRALAGDAPAERV